VEEVVVVRQEQPVYLEVLELLVVMELPEALEVQVVLDNEAAVAVAVLLLFLPEQLQANLDRLGAAVVLVVLELSIRRDSQILLLVQVVLVVLAVLAVLAAAEAILVWVELSVSLVPVRLLCLEVRVVQAVELF